MREITEIIIHCTATPRGRHVTVENIGHCHVKQNGWNDIGYHYVVYLDGTIHPGRPEADAGAHCSGHNSRSVGVAYVGGVEIDGRPADTRTPEQKRSLKTLVASLLEKYPGATVHGHNEFAAKACPAFDVAAEFGKKIIGIIAAIMLATSVTGCGTVKKTVGTKERQYEKSVGLMTEKQRIADRLFEVADLTVSIDSAMIERFETDGRRAGHIKTGPVTLKLSKRRVTDETADVETMVEAIKTAENSDETMSIKETALGKSTVFRITVILAGIVLLGVLYWKISRK